MAKSKIIGLTVLVHHQKFDETFFVDQRNYRTAVVVICCCHSIIISTEIFFVAVMDKDVIALNAHCNKVLNVNREVGSRFDFGMSCFYLVNPEHNWNGFMNYKAIKVVVFGKIFSASTTIWGVGEASLRSLVSIQAPSTVITAHKTSSLYNS